MLPPRRVRDEPIVWQAAGAPEATVLVQAAGARGWGSTPPQRLLLASPDGR